MARAWKPSTRPSPCGAVNKADGNPLAQPLREALVTRDRKQVFRVDDGIPVLLPEEAIPTAQIADFPAA